MNLKNLLWNYSDTVNSNGERSIKIKTGLIPNILLTIGIVYIIYKKVMGKKRH